MSGGPGQRRDEAVVLGKNSFRRGRAGAFGFTDQRVARRVVQLIRHDAHEC